MSPESYNNVVEGTQIGKRGYMFILDNDGVMIANPKINLLGTKFDKTGIMKPIYKLKVQQPQLGK